MFKKLAVTGALGMAVAASVLGAAPANADINTSGAGGVLSGNQVVAPISIPVDVCGNAIAVLGIAGAGCQGGAATHTHS
ncbi:chaplin family protein [Actinomadura parmotrematis]|uniref:Chaplin n=1 Tax=Actinomadura parmotrematis TaxID=2864039 RepID=A0ABS7FX13_9ACTN|nr:chaplin family protein [Actinomadura parmotrematis]MBW8484972.1 chaplin [Actinomadura parmotrematis]